MKRDTKKKSEFDLLCERAESLFNTLITAKNVMSETARILHSIHANLLNQKENIEKTGEHLRNCERVLISHVN